MADGECGIVDHGSFVKDGLVGFGSQLIRQTRSWFAISERRCLFPEDHSLGSLLMFDRLKQRVFLGRADLDDSSIFPDVHGCPRR